MDRLHEYLVTYKLPLVLSFVGIVLLTGGIFSSGLLSKPASSLKSSDFPQKSIVRSSSLSEIKIDVSGAVATPGVYAIASDSRVEDAIKKAGGFSANANSDFIAKKLNLSAKLSDAQKIYIPRAGEDSVSIGQVSSAVLSLVGINSASDVQLDNLPGIGPSTSAKIVSSRPYSSLDELVSRKVISKSLYEKIKDKIDLN